MHIRTLIMARLDRAILFGGEESGEAVARRLSG